MCVNNRWVNKQTGVSDNGILLGSKKELNAYAHSHVDEARLCQVEEARDKRQHV